MTEAIALYDVHGAGIRVEAENAALVGPIDDILSAFRRPALKGQGFVLRLIHGNPAPTEDAAAVPVVWQGILPAGEPLVARIAPGRRILELTGYAIADIDTQGRQARITVQRGRTGPLMDGCLMPALCEALSRADHHVVHAASLFVKQGRRRRAVLISARSGAGKTTTALALAASGMEYLTDDTSFVSGPGGRSGLRVWGLPTRLKILARTLSLLPWLERFQRGPGRLPGEYSLDARAIAPEAARHTAAPGVVCFLDARNDHEHRVEPMDKVAALARLVRENVRAHETAATGPAGRAFAALAALVRECPTYRLSLCPRVETVYDVIAPLVER